MTTSDWRVELQTLILKDLIPDDHLNGPVRARVKIKARGAGAVVNVNDPTLS